MKLISKNLATADMESIFAFFISWVWNRFLKCVCAVGETGIHEKTPELRKKRNWNKGNPKFLKAINIWIWIMEWLCHFLKPKPHWLHIECEFSLSFFSRLSLSTCQCHFFFGTKETLVGSPAFYSKSCPRIHSDLCHCCPQHSGGTVHRTAHLLCHQ